MKNLLTPRLTLATSLLLGSCPLVPAQALGPVHADAWVGRPLEISLPANLAAGEGRDDCVQADVFYGDQRVKAHQVRVTMVGPPQQRRVRVESDRVIDEPIVTVAVRAGCTNTITRSYTLLPEFPSEAMQAAAALPRSVQPGGVLTTALASVLPPRAALPTQTAGAPPARPMATRAALRLPDAVPAGRGRDAGVMRVSDGGGSRLRLQSWEPDAQTLLRVTGMLTEPTQDAARRATAALLWQALNADPSELMRTSAAVQKLEGELAQLRQAAGQTRNEMASLRQRLESPQPALFSARSAQFVALLLLLIGATAAFLWYRNQRSGRAPAAWSGAPREGLDSVQPPPQASPQPGQQPQQAQFLAPAADPATAKPGGPRAGSVPAALPQHREPPARQPAPVAALPTPRRAQATAALRIETLAATFDEVEFLSSLGLWNDAMDVLKTYIEDSGAPVPLAFFELMRLCVNTDDAATLVAVRKRYAKVFRKEAPKFEQINAAPGLEGHPELASHITRAWGTPAALDLIEQSLFMVPAPGQAFSLNAGRDLLVLHDLAMALVRDAGQAQEPGQGDDGHDLAPWAHAENADHARSLTQDIADSLSGHRFALDLDLDAAVAVGGSQQPELADAALLAQFEAAGAEVDAQQKVREEDDVFSAAVANEKVRSMSRS